MDHTVHAHDRETDRAINNELAWKNLSGYRTTSGCPCWDRSDHLCIPKHSGWGYNVNFWYLFCFCLCEEASKPVIPAGVESRRLSTRHTQHLHGSTRNSSKGGKTDEDDRGLLQKYRDIQPEK